VGTCENGNSRDTLYKIRLDLVSLALTTISAYYFNYKLVLYLSSNKSMPPNVSLA
jgi:hypothetical protein